MVGVGVGDGVGVGLGDGLGVGVGVGVGLSVGLGVGLGHIAEKDSERLLLPSLDSVIASSVSTTTLIVCELQSEGQV